MASSIPVRPHVQDSSTFVPLELDWNESAGSHATYIIPSSRLRRMNASLRVVLLSVLLQTIRLQTASSFMSLQMASSPCSNSSNADNNNKKLYLHTPFIHSIPLSVLAKRRVYCKLDALQASGSFKDRGVAYFCSVVHSQNANCQLISSSGGNAGLAVATIGKALNMKVHVIVPQTTKDIVVQKLRALGARVTVHGVNWNEADGLARKLVDEVNGKTENDMNDDSISSATAAVYISPYDHFLLWKGHSSVVDEILGEDLPKDVLPAAMVLSVGGGGLLCGVLEGLQRHQVKTTVIASETDGACSFAKALEHGQPIRLEAITTVATSLGALEVTPATLDRAKSYHKVTGGTVQSAVCTDAEAVNACLQFAQDHRLLVEPACGAALAVVYSERLRNEFIDSLDDKDGPIVIEVCGGSGVSIELLSQWKKEYCNGDS
jgi:L-serine/L-threonine ammonia-lyase